MPFDIHPDKDLVKLFKAKPFQGQDYKEASIIFLNSDANYSPQILSHPLFKIFILEYHKDGVAFWKKHECHHPFRLTCYPFDKRKDGVLFHRNFSYLGKHGKFRLDPPKYASHISFLELLDFPTTGNKSEDLKQFDKLASRMHLQKINDLITGGDHKLFFVSNGVLQTLPELKKPTLLVYLTGQKILLLLCQKGLEGTKSKFTIFHILGYITNWPKLNQKLINGLDTTDNKFIKPVMTLFECFSFPHSRSVFP